MALVVEPVLKALHRKKDSTPSLWDEGVYIFTLAQAQNDISERLVRSTVSLLFPQPTAVKKNLQNKSYRKWYPCTLRNLLQQGAPEETCEDVSMDKR